MRQSHHVLSEWFVQITLANCHSRRTVREATATLSVNWKANRPIYLCFTQSFLLKKENAKPQKLASQTRQKNPMRTIVTIFDIVKPLNSNNIRRYLSSTSATSATIESFQMRQENPPKLLIDSVRPLDQSVLDRLASLGAIVTYWQHWDKASPIVPRQVYAHLRNQH